MKKLILKQGITLPVVGRCYRGIPSELRFIDSPRCGWFWRPRGSGDSLPVNAGLARYYRPFGFMYLRYGRFQALPVWEHIGVLAWIGLSGVLVESTWHPPHFGRVKEFLDALKPHLVESSQDTTWCRPERSVSWRYPDRDGYTSLEPHADPQERSLKVRIKSSYKGIGILEREFEFPGDTGTLLRAFDIFSPAYPPKWKWRFATLATQCGWPHKHRMVWPHSQTPEETIELFLLHRLVDLLGAFSLASHRHLPSGILTSYCAGLEADLHVLQQAQFSLIV